MHGPWALVFGHFSREIGSFLERRSHVPSSGGLFGTEGGEAEL